MSHGVLCHRCLQEEQLFHDLAAVIAKVKYSASASEARDLALQLRRMCAAVRASLETHVRAEEAELWPLFSEHFSIKEQQHLVGVIIGRTGAEVLQVWEVYIRCPASHAVPFIGLCTIGCQGSICLAECSISLWLLEIASRVPPSSLCRLLGQGL